MGMPVVKLEKMDEVYNMSSSSNSEIRYRWIRLGLKAHWEKPVEDALKMVTEQGRMKYVRPLYRDLYAWEEVRPKAIATFNANKKFMMHVSAYVVAKDLHLTVRIKYSLCYVLIILFKVLYYLLIVLHS